MFYINEIIFIRKEEIKMNKRILSIIMVLALMILLTTTAFADATTSTVTTFHGTVSISNVVKVTETCEDESFDQDKVNKTLKIDEESFSEETEETYYCSSAPVTVTFNEVKEGWEIYGISSYRCYYISEEPEPTFNLVEYNVKLPSREENVTVTADAFSGTTTLNKPGTYYLYLKNRSGSGEDYDIGIYIVVEDKYTPAYTPLPTTVKAIPTPSKVYVNGTLTEFEAYGINGNNYFKLRDLAKVVDGTDKNFEVTWDGEKKSINLVSNKGYTEVGGELAKGDGKEKTATLNTSIIYKDGEVVSLTAYTINGNNYFKLRDVAKAFNIGVTWDGATSTIGIDTAIDYVP